MPNKSPIYLLIFNTRAILFVGFGKLIQRERLFDDILFSVMQIDSLIRLLYSTAAEIEDGTIVHHGRAVADGINACWILNGDGACGEDKVIAGIQTVEVVGNIQLDVVTVWLQGVGQRDGDGLLRIGTDIQARGEVRDAGELVGTVDVVVAEPIELH